MRVSPLGNFMSWPSEVFRTGAGIFRIMKDLKDPVTGKINPITSKNPMKAEGMKRLIGTVTAMGVIPYSLIRIAKHFMVLQEEAGEETLLHMVKKFTVNIC